MEIVTIEKKTFEEMKERFNRFSEHVQQLCSRYRPPEKMNWLDNADVCEKLNVGNGRCRRTVTADCWHTAKLTTRFITGWKMWKRL